MNRQTEHLYIPGPIGTLEILRDKPAAGHLPDSGTLAGTAIIAHPHPLFGGTMHNKIVQTLARAFVASGWVAVRFNFRGAGESAGEYDEGRGEVADMLSVIVQLAPKGPLAIAGFSFGAHVCVQTGRQLDGQREVQTQVLVGLAAKRFAVPPLLPHWYERTLVLHAQDDEVVPFSAIMEWAKPQELPVLTLPEGGHFLHGRLHVLKAVVMRHLQHTHCLMKGGD